MHEYGEKSMFFFRGVTFKIIYLEILVAKVPSYFNRGIAIRYILLGKEVSFLESIIFVQ